jgi:hypothetical protein
MDNQERRKILIDFILHNQGCTKADIEKALPISRKTIFRLIDELKEDEIVEEIQEKPNSREHKLFVKKDNPLIRVTSELEQFEKAYLQLLIKLKESTNKEDFSAIAAELYIKKMKPSLWSVSEFERYLEYDSKKVSEVKRASDLRTELVQELDRRKAQSNIVDINTVNKITSLKNELKLVLQKLENPGITLSVVGPILILKTLIYINSCRSTIIWPQIIKDKKTLKKLYSIVYAKIAEIQICLTRFLRSFDKLFTKIEDTITKYAVYKYFSSENMMDFISLDWFTYYELTDAHIEIQAILKTITRMTKEIEQHGGYSFGLSERLDEISSLPTMRLIMESK